MPQASFKDNLRPAQAAASGVIVILIWNSKTAAPNSPQGVANPHPSWPGVGGGEGARSDSSSWACQQFGKTRRILPEWPLPRMPSDPKVMGGRAQTSHSPRPKAWWTDSMWHIWAGVPTTCYLQRVSPSSTSVPKLDNRREGAGQISPFVLLPTLVQGPRVPGTQRLCS